MDKEKLDMKAVELSLAETGKEAIIGFFGVGDSIESLHKMHTMLELTDKLKIDNLTISVSLKELRKAKKEWDEMEKEDEEIELD